MKQALQFRLGQSLTMTPQLQQAIRLLQLSTLELNAEIQDALDSNMMLEMGDEGENSTNEKASSSEENTQVAAENNDVTQNENIDASSESNLENTSETTTSDTMPDDLPVDTSWDDIYDSILPGTTSTASSSYSADDQPEVYTSSTEDLHDRLRWQLKMTPFSEIDAAIAEVIVDEINDDGFLQSSIEEITASLADLSADIEVEADEVEAVLRQIQNFDPAGVGARDLRESISIQLHRQPNDVDLREYAITLVDNYFDLLANREYPQLMRKLKISEDDLKDVIQLIQSMNPRPGGQENVNKAEYIIPDVTVKKVNNTWKVELNSDAAPKLRINATYANMIKSVKNSDDNSSMKNHLQEARWFIKSLLSRNETLLKVAHCIVERQKEFLEHGEEAMKALVLHDIAEAVDMHESTISRVTTKKYMHTPRGIFELKYFFSSHVSTASGGECSATAIRALIKKLIAAEMPKKPLSDNKIALILEDQGINVARRTVAKYRESLTIPPSNERKRLA
ncbi:MAG: RNA polymerase factor sigma-54 [Gammaproteobacteria bacterium]|nr:RNA polymerase factor sigma-54 [Gammaproteobacteria bacterium]